MMAPRHLQPIALLIQGSTAAAGAAALLAALSPEAVARSPAACAWHTRSAAVNMRATVRVHVSTRVVCQAMQVADNKSFLQRRDLIRNKRL